MLKIISGLENKGLLTSQYGVRVTGKETKKEKKRNEKKSKKESGVKKKRKE